MLSKIGKRGQISLDPSEPIMAVIWVLIFGFGLFVSQPLLKNLASNYLSGLYGETSVLLSFFFVGIIPIFWFVYFLVSGIYLYKVVFIGSQ